MKWWMKFCRTESVSIMDRCRRACCEWFLHVYVRMYDANGWLIKILRNTSGNDFEVVAHRIKEERKNKSKCKQGKPRHSHNSEH